MLNPLSELTTFGFDAIGRQTVQILGNRTRASWTYDAASNVTNLANLNSSGVALSNFAYLYDQVGNRQRVVEVSGDRVSWAYDATDQLTHEIRDGANAYEVTHVWDPVGNRLLKIDGGVRTTATYNAAKELLWTNDSAGRATFAFDASGNLVQQLSPALGRTSYTWDGENYLVKVALPTAVVNTMIYNADGLRVEKDDSSGTTKSLWDCQNILLDANASNVTQALYTSQPSLFGNLLSQSRGGQSSFYQFEALGSTVALTNNLQGVTDSYLYNAFGELLTSSGIAVNPWRFVGRHGYAFDLDPAKSYVRSRFYDGSTARFLSMDFRRPLAETTNLHALANDLIRYGAAGGLPISAGVLAALGSLLQRASSEAGHTDGYRYVVNNPVVQIDPSGLGLYGDCVQRAFLGAIADLPLCLCRAVIFVLAGAASCFVICIPFAFFGGIGYPLCLDTCMTIVGVAFLAYLGICFVEIVARVFLALLYCL